MIKKTHKIIPSNDGWFFVEPCVDSDKKICSLSEEPIIAWEIETEIYYDFEVERDSSVSVIPITIDGRYGSLTSGPFILKKPDGTYIEQCNQTFETLDDVRMYFEIQRLKNEN